MKRNIPFLILFTILFYQAAAGQGRTNISFGDLRKDLRIEKQSLTADGSITIRITDITPASKVNEVKGLRFFQGEKTNAYLFSSGDIKTTGNVVEFKLEQQDNVPYITIKNGAGEALAFIPLPKFVDDSGGGNTPSVTPIGIPIYDAYNISELSKKGDTAAIKVILKHYSDESKFTKNPFFTTDRLFTVDKALLQSKSLPPLFNQIGGTNVTTFVDGLARFIVTRAKEELNIAFFNRLKKLFDKYPEFKILFPNTIEFLAKIDPSMYASIIQALQEAFEKDCIELSNRMTRLQTMPEAMCATGDKDCPERIKAYRSFFNKPEGNAFISLLFVTDGLIKAKTPADIIAGLTDSITSRNNIVDPLYKLQVPANYLNGLKLSKLVSESIRSNDDANVYAPAAFVRNIVKDKRAFRIYLGLLYELNEKSPIAIQVSSSSVEFKQVLTNYATRKDENNAIGYFEDLITSIIAINQHVEEIKDKINNNGAFNYVNYTNYYNSLLNFADRLSNFPKLSPTIAIEVTVIKDRISIARTAGKVYYDVSNRSYGSAILNTVTLLESTFFKYLDDNTSTLKASLEPSNQFKDDFIKYGNFIGTVAQAQTGEEVEQAIDAVALPAGSSSIKKRTPFNIAINSYIGGHVGKERVMGAGSTVRESKNAFNSAGIVTPVGVAFSTGFPAHWKHPFSASLFGSVIDISAATTYRLQDSNSEIKSDITLANIISPGGYLILGLPAIPISIGAGWQINPNLNKVTVEGIQINPNRYQRFSLFLAVDIPIINLYTSPKRRL